MRWKLRCRIGELDLEARQWVEGDPATPAPPYLLDARWIDELDTERRSWPLRQGPSTARVTLILAAASDAAFINTTTPVVLAYFLDEDDDTQTHLPATAIPGPVASFRGLASDPVIQPHERGVRVTVTCADHLTPLGQYTVGSGDWPAEDTEARVLRMFDLADVIPPWLPEQASTSNDWPTLAARTGSATSLLAEVQGTLDQSALNSRNGQAYLLYEVRPHFRAELDEAPYSALEYDEPNPLEPYRADVLDGQPTSPAPGTLEQVEGTWRVTFDPADLPAPGSTPYRQFSEHTGWGVIPAEATDFDATWARRASRDVDTVDVVYNGGKNVTRTTINTEGSRVVERVEAPYLTTSADAAELGAALLPDTQTPGSAWEAESFTIYPELAPEGWWPLGIVDWSTGVAYDTTLRAVMVLDGLQPHHSPEARTWWAGVVSYQEVEVAGGRVRLQLGLIARPIHTTDDTFAGWRGIQVDELPGNLDDYDQSTTIQALAHARPTV